MFFNHNNDIDEELSLDSKKKSPKKKNTKKKKEEKFDFNFFKVPLIVLGILLFIIFTIFLISKLSNRQIVYEEKLYYINLVGDSNITLYLGEEYVEPGYTGKDDSDNDLTDAIVVENNIDINKIGNYQVIYTLGNITKGRNVKVIEKPVGATHIHLYGDVNVFLYVGEKYEEKGYEIVDTVDGASLKDKVTINSNVDTSKEGIYHVIYSVTNTSGITTSIERSVVVMDRTLSLLTDSKKVTNKNVVINIYAKDELFDYIILPNNLKITERISTYEVSNNGTYKFLMYNTKDEKVEKSITINNIDKIAPSGSCSGYYKGGISLIEVKASDNSGISKYVIEKTAYTSSTIKLNKEVSSVNITIYDKAGNSKAISCNLTNKNPKPTPTKTPTKKPTKTPTKTPPNTNEPTLLNVPAGTNVRKDYDSEMSYIEIMPSNATTNMPLVIYLDGAWSYASFPDNVLGRSVTKYVENGSAYTETGEKFLYISPRYVISDGSGTGLNWWGSHGPREAKKIAGLIDHLYNKYKIDKKRIYITGVSLGGDGVFYMINAYPNLFAAGTVVSGCAFSASASNFVGTAVLGYNGTGAVEQRAGYTSCVPSMISKINSAGGTAESRVKSGWDHGNMIDVYSTDKDVFKWMFKYKR